MAQDAQTHARIQMAVTTQISQAPEPHIGARCVGRPQHNGAKFLSVLTFSSGLFKETQKIMAQLRRSFYPCSFWGHKFAKHRFLMFSHRFFWKHVALKSALQTKEGSPVTHWQRHTVTTLFQWQCLHYAIANCNYGQFIPKCGEGNSWQRFGVHISCVVPTVESHCSPHSRNPDTFYCSWSTSIFLSTCGQMQFKLQSVHHW